MAGLGTIMAAVLSVLRLSVPILWRRVSGDGSLCPGYGYRIRYRGLLSAVLSTELALAPRHRLTLFGCQAGARPRF